MAAQTPPSPTRSRRPLRRPEVRASVAAAAVVLAVVAVLAVVDPSGLLAPVGGRGVPVLGAGGAYRWAPLVVGLPLLLVGTAVPVHVVVRAGGRRVFLTAWAAAVGAGTLAAAVTGVVAALPVVGPHLSLGAVVRFAFATSGFAGLKLLAVGPLVGAAAALASRLGPRPLPGPVDERPHGGRPSTDAFGLPVVVMFGVVSLAAGGFAARTWRGGPVGYAFAGPLVAPTVEAGVLGILAGTVVFVGIFAWLLRPALLRSRGRSRWRSPSGSRPSSRGCASGSSTRSSRRCRARLPSPRPVRTPGGPPRRSSPSRPASATASPSG